MVGVQIPKKNNKKLHTKKKVRTTTTTATTKSPHDFINPHMHAHTYTCARARAHTHTHTQAHTHTHTHRQTDTHTHTHTHTQPLTYLCPMLCQFLHRPDAPTCLRVPDTPYVDGYLIHRLSIADYTTSANSSSTGRVRWFRCSGDHQYPTPLRTKSLAPHP